MKNIKKYLPYILIFIMFLTITQLCPLTGDDWGNFQEVITFKSIFLKAISLYFTWEGRFISRLLIMILTRYKIIWSIINSLLITYLVYIIQKIINPKNKKLIFLGVILILISLNIKTFSEVIVSVASNITYLFVIPLLLYYFNIILSKKENNKNRIIILAFLNFIMTMFVEHIAVILVGMNFLILIYQYIKTKKVNKELLLYSIISLIGLIIMLLSPGSQKRALIENIEFNKLNIFQKIIYNIPNFIYYTFTVNYYLAFLLTIANYFLIKKTIKKRKYQILSYLYLLPIPILNSIIYLYKNIFYTNVEISTSIYLMLYFISYIIIDFILIYKFTKKDKVNKIMFFYLLGIGANFVMLVAPTWGYRTSLASYIFLSIAYLLIIDRNIIEKKSINYLLLSTCSILSLFYLILYTSVYLQINENKLNINAQLKQNKNTVEIKRLPSFVSSNINPENDYHLEKYKLYYKIPQDKEIIIIPNNWKYQIIYSKN